MWYSEEREKEINYHIKNIQQYHCSTQIYSILRFLTICHSCDSGFALSQQYVLEPQT